MFNYISRSFSKPNKSYRILKYTEAYTNPSIMYTLVKITINLFFLNIFEKAINNTGWSG